MSPVRRRAVVAVALVLAALGLLTAGISAVSRLRASDQAVPQDRLGTVLLVPGYGAGTSGLQVLAAALRANGRSVDIVASVGNGTGDLRAQAELLGSAADRAIDAGAPSVDVVGYSAGGVVARLWAADLGGAAQARRIVTLGAPHHGADLAQLGAAFAPSACPLACRQLVPGSDLLSRLEETPDGPVWTSLWSTDDQTVTPPETARLRGALDLPVQLVCPDARVQHGELPRDPLVTGLTQRALGVTPLLTAPPPSECAALRAEGSAG